MVICLSSKPREVPSHKMQYVRKRLAMLSTNRRERSGASRSSGSRNPERSPRAGGWQVSAHGAGRLFMGKAEFRCICRRSSELLWTPVNQRRLASFHVVRQHEPIRRKTNVTARTGRSAARRAGAAENSNVPKRERPSPAKLDPQAQAWHLQIDEPRSTHRLNIDRPSDISGKFAPDPRRVVWQLRSLEPDTCNAANGDARLKPLCRALEP